MEYYKEFSTERKQLRGLWDSINPKTGHRIDWEEFLETAENIKQNS